VNVVIGMLAAATVTSGTDSTEELPVDELFSPNVRLLFYRFYS
jgi:hypothetical protein